MRVWYLLIISAPVEVCFCYKTLIFMIKTVHRNAVEYILSKQLLVLMRLISLSSSFSVKIIYNLLIYIYIRYLPFYFFFIFTSSTNEVSHNLLWVVYLIFIYSSKKRSRINTLISDYIDWCIQIRMYFMLYTIF